MPKFRIHYDVRRPDNKGGTSSCMDVEADLEFTAVQIAQAQFFAGHRNMQLQGYQFVAKRIEKKR